MKTSLIILFLLLSNSPGYPLDSVSPSLLASNELSWVDEQVQAIKPSRNGMNKHELAKISDPFIFLKKNREEEKKKEPSKKQITTIVKQQTINTNSVKSELVLEAVLNKSVMINGIWYRLKENVSGYKVSEINRNSVLLTKNKKYLLLTTKTRNTKIKFQK